MALLHVLVAESNETLRRRMVRILHWQFRVSGAVGNGEELVKVAPNLNPHVIVANVSLSELDGISAMTRLKAAGHDIPFVFVCAKDSVAEYLEKAPAPYVHQFDLPSDLNDAIRAAVAGQPFLSYRYLKPLS